MKIAPRTWRLLAITGSVFNAGAAVVAYLAHDMIHGTIHVFLALVFALVAARIAQRA